MQLYGILIKNGLQVVETASGFPSDAVMVSKRRRHKEGCKTFAFATSASRSLAGALQYLTFTRPNLSYVVQHVCLYVHDPRELHFSALKRILRYVRGTLDYILQLYVSNTAQLTAYTDADWACYLVTRRSTSGNCVFLGDNLLSWSAKRQATLYRSSAEAEYRGVANVVAETA
ncbi:ribonuclease H-like domain-containing protein [Tanacetum coccineum]